LQLNSRKARVGSADGEISSVGGLPTGAASAASV
jgi:hypothetical protein